MRELMTKIIVEEVKSGESRAVVANQEENFGQNLAKIKKKCGHIEEIRQMSYNRI